jgi:peroxiredoxin Q/BCP
MSLTGKTAPDFDLEGSDGKRHKLSDYRGKRVVIYFYPKDNTPGCTKEACGFRDLKTQVDTLDVVVFGISKDSLKSHDKFIKDFGLNFILLSDPDTTVMLAYGAYGEKVMYGKKCMGIIRSTAVIGADGTVMKHWPKVAKAETHPEEVITWLKAQEPLMPVDDGEHV